MLKIGDKVEFGKHWYLYVLKVGDVARYVGVTQCPHARLRSHIKNAMQGDAGTPSEKTKWIREFSSIGMFPVMEIIGVFKNERAALVAEIACYEKHKDNLFNRKPDKLAELTEATQ